QTRAQMQTYLKQIWANVEVTIVFITHDLDEAVFLADRIIVLSANPGTVAEIIEVPLSQPRSAEVVFDPLFIATRLRLKAWIQPGIHQEAEKLPIRRNNGLESEIL